MAEIFNMAKNLFLFVFPFILWSCNSQISDPGSVRDNDFESLIIQDTMDRNISDSVCSANSINPNSDTIFSLIKKVNRWIPVLDWRSEQESFNEGEDIDSFLVYLKQLLSISELKEEYLKTLQLDRSIAPDQKIGVFNIFENTGGSFHSYTTYTFYKFKDSVFINTMVSTLPVNAIYKLANGHYILMGGGITCNTCYSQFITELKVVDNKLDTLYNYTADYRMGYLNDFTYDPETHIFSYDYYVGFVESGDIEENIEEYRVKGRHKF